MAKGKKHTPEQIVSLLRQIEVAVANGKTTPIACRESGITEQTYYRWRKEFGGLQVDQGSAAEGIGTGEREAQAVRPQETYHKRPAEFHHALCRCGRFIVDDG